jgi:hypothetical protein
MFEREFQCLKRLEHALQRNGYRRHRNFAQQGEPDNERMSLSLTVLRSTIMKFPDYINQLFVAYALGASGTCPEKVSA